MALDKQKILNELGSVVNQLQSADCGCMGKIFSNCPRQNNPGTSPSYGGCSHHCHGHHCQGWGQTAPCAGEPHSNQPCMTNCNPRKLYADTYSFLNNNLMQPVVREVYNDLKTINPANTMANNPMASQLGLGGNFPQMNQSMGVSGMDMGHNQIGAGEANPMAQNQMGAGGMSGMPHQMITGGMNSMGQNQMNLGQNQMEAAGMSMRQNQMGGGMVPMGQNHMAGSGMDPMGQNHMAGSGMEPMAQNPIAGGMNSMGHNQMQAGGMKMGQNRMDAVGMNMEQNPLIGSGMNPMEWNMLGSGKSGANPNQMATGGMNIEQNQAGATGMSMGQHQMQGSGMNRMGQNQTPGSEMNPMRQNQMAGSGMSPMGHNQMGVDGVGGMYPRNQMYGSSSGNMYGNAQGNVMAGNMSNMNPTMSGMGASSAQVQAPRANQAKTGQQAAGMFNTMFPGVMQGLGGDLDFDPMSIAIQMNPSNQQRAAMDSMNKLMMGNKEGARRILNDTSGSSAMQPVLQGTKAAAEQFAQGQPQAQLGAPAGYQSAQMHQNAAYQQMTPGQNTGYQLTQQQPSAAPVPQQQVYAAHSGTPTMVTQPESAKVYQQYQHGDPNMGDSQYEGAGDVNGQQPPQQYTKEPLFPAVPNRQPLYAATMKQPARAYQQPPEQQSHPTQRAPLRTHNPMMYSNVKSTVSKTSLMDVKPSGRVPSRSQLQHIYNQYKGSQSFTQQNVRPTERTTHSAGSLNVANAKPAPGPVEKLAGDTINNQLADQLVNKEEHVIGRMGDVPASNKPLDIPQEPPTKQSRCRNGLQDVVFTSYPSSAAWTFHGGQQPLPTGYRYRR